MSASDFTASDLPDAGRPQSGCNEKPMTSLRFQVENLGVIKTGEFTQKPLTIFCGPNNSGKTWVMYSLYHCHGSMAGLAYERRKEKTEKREEKSLQQSLAEFNKQLSTTLADVFNTSPELLANARFRLAGFDESHFQDFLNDPENTEFPFLMPAERNGLHLFFRELSTRRAALLHHASKDNIDLNELLKDVIRSRYALPIAHYINWLNQLPEIQRGSAKLADHGAGPFHQHALQLQKQLANGAYKVERRSGVIRFKPYQRIRGTATQSMGLHMASSTVKSLFGLWFYLENQAQPGDLLMIDEPELNIHPANQRHIARLLARLVNAGLRIVISTHSDYIVREFNSLLMLSQDNGELRKKHRYSEDEVLAVEQVSACLFDKQSITPFEISPEDGIYATTFDTVIEDLNRVNDDIHYSLQEKRGSDFGELSDSAELAERPEADNE